MDAEKLNQALYEKMSEEQSTYRDWLLTKSPEEILNHAYAYVMREDILMEMEELSLPAPLAAALLESPSPMADVYKDFRDMETGHMDHVRECIEGRAERLMEAQREATRSIPLYQQSSEYAMEHGELDAFRASRKANVACRGAIETAISEGFDGMYLTTDAKGVLAEFGPERVSYVLAATLQDKAWDQRFSHGNQAWAAAVAMVEPQDRRSSYIINSHSTLLDGFVGMVRKELDAMREQAAKKPSIKEQLAVKPAPNDQPANPKDSNTVLQVRQNWPKQENALLKSQSLTSLPCPSCCSYYS